MARPTVMTPQVVDKLEQAFALGCTDLEACLFADIDKKTLYNYQDANPEFIHRKEQLKETPVLQARTSVIKHMHDDGDLALKYLERKRKDEFSTKSEVDMKAKMDITRIEDVIVDSQNSGSQDIQPTTETKPV